MQFWIIPTEGTRLDERHDVLGPYNTRDLADYKRDQYSTDGVPCEVIESATRPGPIRAEIDPAADGSRPRRCLWIDPLQDTSKYGGYVPSMVTENEPGHLPLVGNGKPGSSPWVWGSDLETAQRICEEANAKTYGLTPLDALLIVASSMGAS